MKQEAGWARSRSRCFGVDVNPMYLPRFEPWTIQPVALSLQPVRHPVHSSVFFCYCLFRGSNRLHLAGKHTQRPNTDGSTPEQTAESIKFQHQQRRQPLAEIVGSSIKYAHPKYLAIIQFGLRSTLTCEYAYSGYVPEMVTK
jgi:hypothetical protein